MLAGEGIGLFALAEERVRAAVAADRDPRAEPVGSSSTTPASRAWARGAATVAIQDAVDRIDLDQEEQELLPGSPPAAWQEPSHELDDRRTPRGGPGPSSTRSTRAPSRTPTATASATCAGILGRLDHLAELGVDVVWLSPVYPSPQDDNGYDISDYQDIDPTFGTLADFDELLAGAARPRA